MSLEELYRQVILDHYRNPRHRGHLDHPATSAEGTNPLCGDEITVELAVDGDRVTAIAVSGQGCSISQASASMMGAVLKGKTVEEALSLMGVFTRMLHGDLDAAADTDLGDLRALAGVSKFPVRVKCALLAWNCLDEMVGPEAPRP